MYLHVPLLGDGSGGSDCSDCEYVGGINIVTVDATQIEHINLGFKLYLFVFLDFNYWHQLLPLAKLIRSVKHANNYVSILKGTPNLYVVLIRGACYQFWLT